MRDEVGCLTWRLLQQGGRGEEGSRLERVRMVMVGWGARQDWGQVGENSEKNGTRRDMTMELCDIWLIRQREYCLLNEQR